MKTISNFLHCIANWKSLVVFLALYISFPAYFLKNAEAKINELAGKTVGVIDLTVGFNPQKSLDMVAGYGDAARAYYARTEMTTDVAYPIVYAFLFGTVLTLLYRNTSYARVNTLPFVMLLFDYAENICIVGLLQSFPQQSVTVATFCEAFKLLKWVVFGVIVLLIVGGLIGKLMNRGKQI
ncbi:MAG: hypothetical protein IPL27_22270 [Lewinellaceae bacterium]|nr:hypothetical protein [Lewinellaceae bacterium]